MGKKSENKIKWITDEIDFKQSNRAANIKMLRKIADKMGKTELLYSEKSKKKEGIWSASKNTINKIATMKPGGDRWNYKEDAKKLLMDKRVYTGEYLIKINGKAFQKFKKEFRDKKLKQRCMPILIEKFGASNKKQLEAMFDEVPVTEELLWNFILDSESWKSEWVEEVLKSKGAEEALEKLIWADLDEQIEKEYFRDLQFWLFWRYLRDL